MVDATGAYVCDDSWALSQGSCELTGTAPFYALVHARDGDAPGGYALAFPRVDGPPACPVVPQGTTGATLTSTADRFAFCRSIPAGQHAASQTLTYRRASGTGTASLSLFDASGQRYCGPTGPWADRTVTCSMPDGPFAVILETQAVDATWQFTHRAATT